MAINFRELAMNELTLSHLMANREQLKTADLIGKELTLTEFDFATITDKDGDAKVYPVVVFAELPGFYYNGGSLLMKLCSCWAGATGGDVETASDALKKEGGVKLRFRETKTKAGNNLVSIDVV